MDPGNVCIITEYSSKGSLQDIIANDDVKLDNMFIASLVFDIIRVSIDTNNLLKNGKLNKASKYLSNSALIIVNRS